MEPDYTQSDVTALADAMKCLLDEIGKTARSPSLIVVAEARIAYEPFRDAEEPDTKWDAWLTYDEAIALQKKWQEEYD